MPPTHQAETTACKADFTSIYDQDTPDAYFRTLTPLDYQIPQQALPVLRRVIAAAGETSGPAPVLDVCCSYAINAALLRCDLELNQVAHHYLDRAGDGSVEQHLAADRDLFARTRRPDAPPMLGLDAAPRAIAYGTEVGLLDDGWAENLEDDEASESLRKGVHEVGVVTCTGGVGYIGPKTFDTLLDLVDDPGRLWLAVFVLRVFDYDDVVATFAERGLVTERLPGRTFLQRRFADAQEQAAAVHDVRARGLDPAGKEADGWFHADCFITRPVAAARDVPLEALLP